MGLDRTRYGLITICMRGVLQRGFRWFTLSERAMTPEFIMFLGGDTSTRQSWVQRCVCIYY